MLFQILDILVLSEICFDNIFIDFVVLIEGYLFVRCDWCRSGGGVVFYICNVIDYKIRFDFFDLDFEFLCIQI